MHLGRRMPRPKFIFDSPRKICICPLKVVLLKGKGSMQVLLKIMKIYNSNLVLSLLVSCNFIMRASVKTISNSTHLLPVSFVFMSIFKMHLTSTISNVKRILNTKGCTRFSCLESAANHTLAVCPPFVADVLMISQPALDLVRKDNIVGRTTTKVASQRRMLRSGEQWPVDRSSSLTRCHTPCCTFF